MSRDNISFDEDSVERRLKQKHNKVIRNAKSEIFTRTSAMEIPKFVLLVEDCSSVDMKDVKNEEIKENNTPAGSEAEVDSASAMRIVNRGSDDSLITKEDEDEDNVGDVAEQKHHEQISDLSVAENEQSVLKSDILHDIRKIMEI